jgi:transcriptional regulator with XRE-family HTH domain
MTETAFSGSYGVFSLLHRDDETSFVALPPRRPTHVRTLRVVDAVTSELDDVLAEAFAELDLTPLSSDTGRRWLPRLTAAEGPGAGAVRERALAAIADIRSILTMSDAATAQLVGVSRNTLASWRRGERDPYPATVRRLFEIHAVVSAASALLGTEASAWFSSHVDAESRLSVLASSDGPARLATELRQALFAATPRSTLPTADEFEEEAPLPASAYVPESFAGPIRQRRALR